MARQRVSVECTQKELTRPGVARVKDRGPGVARVKFGGPGVARVKDVNHDNAGVYMPCTL